jgi:excisionase family DNA binding protein
MRSKHVSELPITEMMTPSQVAASLGVSPNTVRKWSNRGRLPFYRFSPRGDRRYRREDVEAFIASQRVEAKEGWRKPMHEEKA